MENKVQLLHILKRRQCVGEVVDGEISLVCDYFYRVVGCDFNRTLIFACECTVAYA